MSEPNNLAIKSIEMKFGKWHISFNGGDGQAKTISLTYTEDKKDVRIHLLNDGTIRVKK